MPIFKLYESFVRGDIYINQCKTRTAKNLSNPLEDIIILTYIAKYPL